MKVLILGNQARSVRNFWTVLMRRMRAAGHEVVVCVPADGEASDLAQLAEFGRVRTYFLARKGLNPLQDARSFLQLLRILREEACDVLFTSTIKPVIYGCLAARLQHVPHIYATITGLGYTFEADSPAKRLLHAFTAFLYRQSLRFAEGVFFQNADDAALFQEQGILDPKARVLFARGTGVDTQRFAYTPPNPLTSQDPVFLFVGRLLEAKGLREYCAAARAVKARFPKARFQILGPEEHGPGSVALEEVLGWQKAGFLEYLGQTEDVRPYLKACHVLVLPSWREGTPTAVMEAMSTGRAAIVSDAPGCREVVVDGENGRLVRVHDSDALAQAMASFCEHPDDIFVMGKNGRQRAQTLFDAEVVAEHILQAMGLL
ncbi:MAG: glycosyltransferase family 4 protein [Desulfovibrio sp.]|nr:glycosyltransferase family 4 protein [Desulfovibrio sp.]